MRLCRPRDTRGTSTIRESASKERRARPEGRRVHAWLVLAILLVAALPLVVTFPPATAPYTPHARILINGDADFTPANGVTGGSGTPSDPYVIEGWDINVTSGPAIRVANTRAAFSVRNVSVGGGYIGIHLVNVTNARVENSTAYGAWGWGIYAEDAPGVLILNNSLGSNMGGIGVSRSPGYLVRGNVVDRTQDVGIYVDGPGSRVVENRISNGSRAAFSSFGIQLSSATDVVVEANNVSQSWAGIYVESSDRAQIRGNSLRNNTGGVVLSESTRATLRNNTFSGDGVSLWGSDLDHFRSHDVDLTNVVSAKPIRYYRDCNGATIDGLPTGQLILANCTAPTIANLTVSGTDFGLGLYFVERASVAGNNATGNGVAGLSLFRTGNSTVVGNNFSGNGGSGALYDLSGDVLLDSSWNVLVERNNASSSAGDGILVQGTTGASIVRNIAIGDGMGVDVLRSSNTRVVGNLVQADQTAINVEYSTDETIVLNEVRGSAAGIMVVAVGARVYHNALVNNTRQGYQSYPGLPWDDGYPSGGNYWSDYTGVDVMSGPNQNFVGSDGIGDTPVTFQYVGVDRYPLMRPHTPANEPPFAAFAASPTAGMTGTAFTLDASTSWDFEDPTSALQVRWDFQDDGAWDTPWSSAKVVQHVYDVAGVYRVRLEVNDTGGLTNETTQTVIVFLPPHPALPSPGGLTLSRPNADDVRLDWRPVPGATGYRVYGSQDRFAAFPSGWSFLGEPTVPTFTAAGNASDHLPHFYLVRMVNGTEEGPNSTMGAKAELSFTFDPARTNIAWFSLPYNSTYHKASDIANDLGPSKIDLVGRWDPGKQTSTVYYRARGGWRGTDFQIAPGDGLYIGLVASFEWVLIGTDLDVALSFVPAPLPNSRVAWVGLPFAGAYPTASSVADALTATNVWEIGLWDPGTQTPARWYWVGSGWTGTDFPIAPGAGVYVVVASRFTWTPALVTPAAP